MDSTENEVLRCRIQYINDLDPFLQSTSSCSREPLKPLVYNISIHKPICEEMPEIIRQLHAPHKSGDAVLQLSPSANSDLGSILYSEISLLEQSEELQILQNDPRCSLVVRQQPELRVKSIIEKLTHMSGRDQRRALFSLKSIFQNDKDIVHEFVRNGGLECLIQIGRTCDQNHQNHILRAIGQLMLYVDGMNGIIANNETISWIYQLLDSNYRLVVKTALKLLLVFVEYTESNSLLLLAAISKIEKSRGRPEWSSIMRILNERQASDEETLIFAMTVINKTLNGVPDQDTFFDIVDVLESQGLEETIETMLKINNPQLSQQCVHYEQEVRKEDAALESDNGKSDTNDSVKIRSNINNYNSTNNFNQNNGLSSIERRNKRLRKQKEHLQMATTSNINELYKQDYEKQFQKQKQNGFQLNEPTLNTSTVTAKTQQKLPWRNFVEQQISSEYKVEQKAKDDNNNNEEFKNDYADNKDKILSSSPINSSSNFDKNSINTNNYIMDKMKSQSKVSLYDNDTNHNVEEKENIMDEEEQHTVKAPPPCIPTNIFSPTETKHMEFPESSKIISSNVPPAPSLPPPTNNTVFKPNVVDSDEETNNVGCAGGFAAMLQKRAKKMENSAFRRGIVDSINRQSESEIKWNEAAEKLKEKPMIINDLDFSSFTEFEQDPLVLVKSAQAAQDHNIMIGNKGTPPPAPPPAPGAKRMPPPPPLSFNMSGSRNIGINGKADANSGSTTASSNSTLKLHWKPAHADALPIPELKQKGTFWNNIDTVPQIDISKLSRLFEQKQKDTPIKKSGGETKLQVLQVLSVKRSQAINIGLTKLPPITVIPTAIRKFDASVLNKEGIEKILSTMMPSLEEVEHIREAQAENPSTPLGQAEQFLFNLSEIDCLLERLRLWLFMLDYHNLEKDVAESLMELNNAMKEIEESKTFKVAMGMLLTIGNALNGTDIKAFQLDYLSRASEVKDPVHKYPLTHHLAEYMLDHYPDGTDLYSEMGAVSRSSRLDFDAVLDNLKKMETECKACFDYVVKISHRDNNSSMKNKVNTFLIEVAERIHRLKHVHRTTMHRWNAFLLYFGYAPAEVKEQKPIAVFKMVIEFALEYRTNRDKILQMRKRMAEKRERNKTRGMMIGAAQASASNGNNKRQQTTIEASNVTEITDRERHQQMSFFLSNGDGTLTLGRRRGQPTAEQNASQIQAMRSSTTRSDNNANNSEYDELLDGVVRTVTAQADSRDHSRRRARLFNRKSLRRTRTIRQDHLSELNNLTTSYT